jgi:hypothetical protein
MPLAMLLSEQDAPARRAGEATRDNGLTCRCPESCALIAVTSIAEDGEALWRDGALPLLSRGFARGLRVPDGVIVGEGGTAMRVDGRCHCGFITYEAEIEPERVMICHCSDCQMLSGSAFRTVALTVEDGFTLLSGELKTYVKTGSSGARRPQTFCPECGSPIYSTSEGAGPKVYSLRLGTARQRQQLIPKAQIWCRSALTWVDGLASIPGLETQ